MDNDILNTAIISYEYDVKDMNIEEIYEASKELLIIATDVSSSNSFDLDTIEEAEIILEEILDLL